MADSKIIIKFFRNCCYTLRAYRLALALTKKSHLTPETVVVWMLSSQMKALLC